MCFGLGLASLPESRLAFVCFLVISFSDLTFCVYWHIKENLPCIAQWQPFLRTLLFRFCYSSHWASWWRILEFGATSVIETQSNSFSLIVCEGLTKHWETGNCPNCPLTLLQNITDVSWVLGAILRSNGLWVWMSKHLALQLRTNCPDIWYLSQSASALPLTPPSQSNSPAAHRTWSTSLSKPHIRGSSAVPDHCFSDHHRPSQPFPDFLTTNSCLPADSEVISRCYGKGLYGSMTAFSLSV